MNLPAGLGAGFAESGEETAMVKFVAEDGLAAVATIQDVEDGAGMLDSQLASHAERLRISAAQSNRKVV